MKTMIQQNKLAEACKRMRGIVAKSVLDPFAMVRLDAVGGNVSLTGGNSDIQIESRFPGETDENGTVLIPGVYLDRFVSAIPKGPMRLETKGNSKVRLAGGGMEYRLPNADKVYMTMAGPTDAKAKKLEISGIALREMIRKVRYAVSADDTRKVLKGICVEIESATIRMIATDGVRLSMVEHVFEEGCVDEEKKQIVLPAKTVEVLYSLLEDDDMVVVTLDSQYIRVISDDWCVTSKVLEGSFPSWRKVVPANNVTKASIDRETFLGAMNAAALALDGNGGYVMTFEFFNGGVNFSARGTLTNAETKMARCEMSGDEKVVIKLNPKHVAETLSSIDDNKCDIYFNTATDPILIKCSIPFLGLIMPIRN